MLLPKGNVTQEEGIPDTTWSDWLNSLLLLAFATTTVHVGRFILRTVVVPEGCDLQKFFVTPRPLDSTVALTVGSIIALAVLAALITYRYVDWIRHRDGASAKFRHWQILNLFVFVLNQILGALDIRIDTGGQSSQFFSLFTPAPWAFVIWILIYVWEKIFIVYQTLPYQRSNILLSAISPYWIMANVFQTLWCFVFSPYADRVLWVSSLFLAAVAVSLFGTYYQFTNQQNKYFRCYGWPFWFFAQIPLTVHFGWISAAFLVNANSFLVRYQLPLYTQIAAANLCLYVGTALGVLLMLCRFDAIYGLTIVWAINGVRYGTVRCLGNPRCLESLPNITAEVLEAQILTATILTAVLLLVAGLVLLMKLARCILMSIVSFESRDFILKRVPPFLLTYLE